ncbi:hypothetical protein DIPPA_18170 [Diplonema papillatum]|nr:hypothetical protein DIPPA_18170 [Diplonema papillatum]
MRIVVLKASAGSWTPPAFRTLGKCKGGKLDVYRQLTDDYTLQTGPHMRFVAATVKRLLGE